MGTYIANYDSKNGEIGTKNTYFGGVNQYNSGR